MRAGSSMLLLSAFLAATATATVTVATAAELKPSPPVAPGIAAFPRLAGPAGDAAADRINQALGRRDDKVRAAAKSCRAEGGKGAEWSRRITATMTGPRYLSLVATDTWSCGGAHPDSSTMALVYDLATGAPVNWIRLLPGVAGLQADTDTVGDGTVVGRLSAPALRDLYRAGGTKDPDCVEALRDLDPAFQLWPAAAEGGITLQPVSLPHAVAACGDPVTVPMPALRTLGVKADLLDAIDEARRLGLHDRAPK